MVKIETSHSVEQPKVQQPDDEVQYSAAELELLAEVDRQSRETTAADHKAIYESMARDVVGGLAVQAAQRSAK